MSVELQLTDAMWHQMQAVLTTVRNKAGHPPNQDDRMFIEAVLYVAKNGIPWRALPDEFGNWSAVYNRLRRWKNNGTWEKLWHKLATDNLSSLSTLFIDSTSVRVHQHAASTGKLINLTNHPADDYGAHWISDTVFSVTPLKKKAIQWGTLKKK